MYCDEPHRNACSTETANIATGAFTSLESEEKELFVLCYRLLTGSYPTQLKTSDGRLVHQILQLHENAQALVSEEDLNLVFTALAQFLVKQIDPNYPKEVDEYLCNKEMILPKGVKTKNTLFLARGLILDVLRPALRMIHGFDYGPSIRATDQIESPKFQRTPTLAQFENTDIAAALCCQGLYQRGLNGQQIKILILKLVEEYKRHELTNNPQLCSVAVKWKLWQAPIPLIKVNTDNTDHIAKLVESIGKHPDVIACYLQEHLLSEIKIFSQTFQSTAADLIGNGAFSVLFSATLGLQAEYPDLESAYRDDAPFQAAVIQRACDLPNQEIRTFTPRNRLTRKAHDIFDQLAQAGDAGISGFIDLGGWNQDFSTQEMAEGFLDVVQERKLDYDGVIYIKDNTHSIFEKKEIVLILQDKNGERRHLPLQGSNIPQALFQCGIENPDRLKLLKICAADQYTGTDFYFGSDAQIAITIDQSTTLWSLIQAVMRARQFLKPLEDTNSSYRQRIIWVLPKALEEKIKKIYPEITVETLLLWAMEQETNQDHMEQRIIAAAFQGIEQIFADWLWEKIEQSESSEEIQALYQKHTVLFSKERLRDLEKRYAFPNRPENTKVVLTHFVEALCQAANVPEGFQEGHQNIRSIIDQTAMLVPTIMQKMTSTGTVYTHHTEQQKAVGQEQQQQ